VSGIGKITQIAFGLIAPGNVVSNLVAGAVAEAGAQQAGDMMQDLKTGHLLRASPRAQFYGQLIGSLCSILFTVGAYLLYTTSYQIPGPEFPCPTAQVWLDMAQLVNGGKLATDVGPFCIVGALLAACIPVFRAVFPQYAPYTPSGIAFAIGFYVTPNWTIARFVGSASQFLWQR
jgi:OPT family oligopeptide transporter